VDPRQVAGLRARGLSWNQIAEQLGIGVAELPCVHSRPFPRNPSPSRRLPDTFHETYPGLQRMRALSRNQMFLGSRIVNKRYNVALISLQETADECVIQMAKRSKARQQANVYEVSNVPNIPAVYAMYGKSGSGQYVAYVGMAGNLRQRLIQHLVLKDSSVTTGVQAACLKPEFVTEVRWWSEDEFADKNVPEASELVAFTVLDPVLRSRGNITKPAKELSEQAQFRDRMTALFKAQPAGNLLLLSLQDALNKLDEFERRIGKLEAALGEGSATVRS
jgi:hypothetical protein